MTEAELKAALDAAEENMNDKVVFGSRQQARVNELIQEAQGRAAKDLRTELDTTKSTLTTLQADLAAAKADAAKAKTAGARKDANGEVEALQSQIAEIKAAHEARANEVDRLKQLADQHKQEALNATNLLSTTQKMSAINTAASKCGFVDPAEVAELTAKYISKDDKGRFVVLGENGSPRLNSALDPMSLDEFYADYAAKKPYLVRSDVRAGLGSSEAKGSLSSDGKYELKQLFGKGSDARLANQLAMSNPKEYQRLRKIAVEGGLLAS